MSRNGRNFCGSVDAFFTNDVITFTNCSLASRARPLVVFVADPNIMTSNNWRIFMSSLEHISVQHFVQAIEELAVPEEPTLPELTVK